MVAASNVLTRLESYAFNGLPQLATVILTHNTIDRVDKFAFANLDILQKLELQHNRLRQFSLDAFVNCTRQPAFPMALNVSHNNIRRYMSSSPTVVIIRGSVSLWNESSALYISFCT